MCATKMLLLVFIFTTAHFHLSRCLTGATKFSCCSSKELSLLCFSSLALALALSLCYPRQCRHENLVEKKNAALLCLLCLKVWVAMRFTANTRRSLNAKFHSSLQVTDGRMVR